MPRNNRERSGTGNQMHDGERNRVGEGRAEAGPEKHRDLVDVGSAKPSHPARARAIRTRKARIPSANGRAKKAVTP